MGCAASQPEPEPALPDVPLPQTGISPVVLSPKLSPGTAQAILTAIDHRRYRRFQVAVDTLRQQLTQVPPSGPDSLNLSLELVVTYGEMGLCKDLSELVLAVCRAQNTLPPLERDALELLHAFYAAKASRPLRNYLTPATTRILGGIYTRWINQADYNNLTENHVTVHTFYHAIVSDIAFSSVVPMREKNAQDIDFMRLLDILILQGRIDHALTLVLTCNASLIAVRRVRGAAHTEHQRALANEFLFENNAQPQATVASWTALHGIMNACQDPVGQAVAEIAIQRATGAIPTPDDVENYGYTGPDTNGFAVWADRCEAVHAYYAAASFRLMREVARGGAGKLEVNSNYRSKYEALIRKMGYGTAYWITVYDRLIQSFGQSRVNLSDIFYNFSFNPSWDFEASRFTREEAGEEKIRCVYLADLASRWGLEKEAETWRKRVTTCSQKEKGA